MNANPLYQPAALPDFAAIKPEHVNAISAIIAENRQAIRELIESGADDWETLIMPLARMSNRLSKAWSPIAHLHAVCNNEAWRKAYAQALEQLSDYESDLGQNEGLYQAYCRLSCKASFGDLSPARRKLVHDALRDFIHSGVGLPCDEKIQFKKNEMRLSELSTTFANHVLDATQAWFLHLPDATRLQGLPETALALLQSYAKERDVAGYVITLDAPAVLPVLMYAEDRALREEIYRAYNARASEIGFDGAGNDNTEIIKEILALRQEQAELLGFDNYAAYSVDDKMAQRVEVVEHFLEELLAHSKAQGEREMANLRQFAAEECALPELKAWDVSFVSEKLRQRDFSLSQEDLRPYFPVSQVIDGMFEIAKRLFNISFRPNLQMSRWHDDVLCFDVLDKNGERQASFYLDLYARTGKRGGAWMDDAVGRMRDGDSVQLPVAFLTCNFTPPVDGQEALLTHQEVTTIFHEFGHGLHHMLTRVEDLAIAGINGVEWDAVEQPSQFMENFCYTREGLDLISRHVQSGEKLPDELFDKLMAAKNFQSAMAMLRQLEFAIFDFTLHQQTQPVDVLAFLRDVRARVAVVPVDAQNRFPMQFSHIFAGGYAAGYYSYKWAEVLSADSFSAFEEEGLFNPATGARFLNEILAVGASRSSLESFIAFRGRAPQQEALLRHSGIHA